MAEKTKNSNTKVKQTNDYLFKRIFGYKDNEKITEDLIEKIPVKKQRIRKLVKIHCKS